MTVGHLRWVELPTRAGLEIDVNRHVVRGDQVSHDHDFVEVALVLGGSGQHETLYGRRPLGRGDAIAIRPGAWHAFHRCEDLRVVNCCFQTRLLERELLWLAEEPRLRFLLWPGVGVGDGVVHVHLSADGLRACAEALDRLDATPDTEPRPHQVAHLLLLLRSIAGDLDLAQLDDAARVATAPAAVMEALRLMAGDLARDWTVTSLAGAVALSPTHLSRLFHRTVGRPPMAHLAKLRAEAAATRLLRTSEPVSRVGAAVGWSDPNYFARRFRAYFGVSPTAFRRRGAG
jgi:AraC family L-rhamnose operon transcriptional activator RhaR